MKEGNGVGDGVGKGKVVGIKYGERGRGRSWRENGFLWGILSGRTQRLATVRNLVVHRANVS